MHGADQTARELAPGHGELSDSLLAVARAITGRGSLEETLQATLDVAARLTDAQGGSLCLVDEDGRMSRGLFVHGGVSTVTHSDLGDVMERGLSGWVRRHRQPVLLRDTLEDERWIRLADQGALLRAVISVPIISGAQVVGVLGVDHPRPGHFQPRHLELLVAAADQIALALRAAQLLEDRTRQAERQGLLYGLLRTLSRPRQPAEVARIAEEAVARSTGWPAVRITPEVPEPGSCGAQFPLRHGDRVLGYLLVGGAGHRLEAADTSLAESIADALGLALQNALLHASVLADRGRLAAVVEASHEGLLLVGPERRVLVCNEPAARLLGLRGEAAAWLGRPIGEVLDDLANRSPAYAATLAGRLGGGAWDARQGEAEVPPRSLHWSERPVASEGLAMGRLLALRDVTEERNLKRLREDLAATMVHDLRNPLTTVLGVLQQVDDLDAAPERSRELLRIAQRAALRMAGLVDAILEVARLESRKVPLQPAPTALRPLVEEVLEMQEALAVPRGVALECALEPDLPELLVDAPLVARVFQNLLANAIVYGRPGGRVRVAAVLLEGGREVVASIEDDGPGLPESVRARLFEKFVRGTHAGRGSGLGLAFCQLAVEAHGGRIWADSGPSGTTFRFSLPSVECAAARRS